MNTILKKLMISMMVVITLVSLASPVFAASTNQPPSNGNHLQIRGDVKGTKLAGPIHVELSGFNGDAYTQMYVAVRLAKGTVFNTFVGQTTGEFTLSNEAATQAAIVSLLGSEIISTFFPGSCFVEDAGCSGANALDIYTKSVANWSQKADEVSMHFVIDLTLAVK